MADCVSGGRCMVRVVFGTRTRCGSPPFFSTINIRTHCGSSRRAHSPRARPTPSPTPGPRQAPRQDPRQAEHGEPCSSRGPTGMNWVPMELLSLVQVRSARNNKHVILALVERCIGTAIFVRSLRATSRRLHDFFAIYWMLWFHDVKVKHWRAHFSPKRRRLTS